MVVAVESAWLGSVNANISIGAARTPMKFVFFTKIYSPVGSARGGIVADSGESKLSAFRVFG
jgi:hypothetical protein